MRAAFTQKKDLTLCLLLDKNVGSFMVYLGLAVGLFAEMSLKKTFKSRTVSRFVLAHFMNCIVDRI